jgi:hypothetical protein
VGKGVNFIEGDLVGFLTNQLLFILLRLEERGTRAVVLALILQRRELGEEVWREEGAVLEDDLVEDLAGGWFVDDLLHADLKAPIHVLLASEGSQGDDLASRKLLIHPVLLVLQDVA